MSTTSIPRRKPKDGTTASARVPPLLNGDHLTVPEFERRYWAMPEDKRAELIEGIVIMSSPISNVHGESQGTIGFFLKRYAQATPGVSCGINASVRLDGKNEYQPDAFLRIQSGRLARTKVGADGLIDGGPEFVAEIAVSSAAYDMHEKKAVYQRCLVPEYFVWQDIDSQVHWFALEQGEYVELKPQSDGAVHSKVIPGLWLETRALVDGDENKVWRVLEKGLKSSEHASFARHLVAK